MYKLSLFFLLYVLVVLSCSEDAPEQKAQANTQESTSTQDTAEQSTISSDDDLVNEQDTNASPFKKRIAHSMDVALVSDPFFPAIFNTLNFNNFELFYYNAMRLGMNAQLFTLLDTAYDTTALQDTFLASYTPLNNRDIGNILYAKDIIISPLLSQFNPEFVSMLRNYRKAIQRSTPLVFSIKPRNNRATDLQVDNTYALHAMAKDIAAMFIDNDTLERLVILADLKNPIQVSENIRIVLQHLYQIVPTISTEVFWKARHLGEEQQTIQDAFNLNSSSVVFLLFVGSHLDVVLQYMFENKSQWKNKVFIVQTWKSTLHFFGKEGIVVASVDNGLDSFFRKKTYAYSLLRQYK